jgi:hypothetical protein
MRFNKEYFNNNTYFFLKDRGNTISLYYSVSDTLSESRKNDKRKDFDKNDYRKVKGVVRKHLKSKTKTSEKDIEKDLDELNGEMEEIVGPDGSMLNSNVPYLNQYTHPRKTMDQTVPATRTTNDPILRGYRVYWGEGEDEKGNVVNEVDYSDAFGYEETKDMDYEDTVKELEKMGVENAEERAQEFGKSPKLDKSKLKGADIKQRLAEKQTIEERRQKMVKMVEDILTKKSKETSDVVKKKNNVSKIIVKNIKTLKKMADNEGISVNELIKLLKTTNE